MRDILNLLVLGGYIMLVIPTLVLVFTATWIGGNASRPASRQSVLILLGAAAGALALLNLAIWANAYGRHISSSLPAWGILPVVVALLVLDLQKMDEIARLWSDNKIILSALVLLILALLGLVWLAEALTFYIVLGLTAVTALGWLTGTRAGLSWLSGLGLVVVSCLVFFGGGAFLIPGSELPPWLRVAIGAAVTMADLLAIFLCAALLYLIVQENHPMAIRKTTWRWVLIAILAVACAYPVFWDGIWSAVHARAYEDHLPFVQFLASLTAGAVISIKLHGGRRLVGLAFCAVVTTICVLGLTWGWNTSAVSLTEQRAAQVNQAIERYFQENGRYPARLAQVNQRYLIYLPPPVIVSQGGWCYQGGADYYRLGYISGDFTYFESTFLIKVHAQQGQPPPGPWECDSLLEKFSSAELAY